MRMSPLPLENWPAPQFDDQSVESAIRAMDVQAEAGFDRLDVWGLFATYGWPPDVVSALDADRKGRIQRLLAAAGQRGLSIMLGLGAYSWGYDQILVADPDVRGKNADGSPHAHALCDANPKSFEYVKKIIDFALGQFDFGGVHLESCDLGCCACPQCAGKDGVVGYNVRINRKTADYIKARWPDKTVYVITINWSAAGKHFDADQKAKVVELSRHIDCVFDQGHAGYHIAEPERRDFIQQLHCAYGTSGKLWGTPVPGEFKLDQNLFGTSPGPATYLKEPCLDAKGRKEYRNGLKSVLAELSQLDGQCEDQGRLATLRRCVTVTLAMLNTVSYTLGEPIQ